MPKKIDDQVLTMATASFEKAARALRRAVEWRAFLLDTSPDRPSHDMITPERAEKDSSFGVRSWEISVRFLPGSANHTGAARDFEKEMVERIWKLLPKIAREAYDEVQAQAASVVQSQIGKQIAPPPSTSPRDLFAPDNDGVMVNGYGAVQGVGYSRSEMASVIEGIRRDEARAFDKNDGAREDRLRAFRDGAALVRRGTKTADWLRELDSDLFATYFPPRAG